MNRLLFVLALLFLLTACALPNPTPTPEAQSELIVTRVTATSTPTMGNTATAVPPNTPRFTPTYRPSRTPQNTRPPTMTPTPTPTRFVIAAPSTPVGPPSSYQLKQWTEEDAVTAVAEAQQLFQDSLWGGYDDFVYRAEHAVLVDKETLAHFPASSDRQAIVWNLLLMQLVSDAHLVNPISQLLEDALNDGEVVLGDLDAYLLANNLSLGVMLPADNLFGDDEPVTILQITYGFNQYISQDVFLALTGSETGKYQITVIQDWTTGIRPQYEIFPLEDYNGNGLMELGFVQVNNINGTPTRCAGILKLFEWRENQTEAAFVNLTSGINSVRKGVVFPEERCRSVFSSGT